MIKLTVKQENFCNFYVETGNASEAYRRAYECRNMKPKTVSRKALELMENGIITAYIEKLREELKAKSDIRKEDIIRLCAEVLGGESVIDFTEENNGNIKKRTVPKTWAAERLCKMLGFDSPTEISVNKEEDGMTREDILKELERLENIRKQ